eukprot:TRINITY_DN752_c0_g1_i1.p1 TRINITY_DN752_c0_g1~~TRINITY_DN752_c0_g1_i1.p1  ORF type:complete len:297 (+),score=76.40 TRINITY_DN752_c0_g1_i1:75-965(+)
MKLNITLKTPNPHGSYRMLVHNVTQLSLERTHFPMIYDDVLSIFNTQIEIVNDYIGKNLVYSFCEELENQTVFEDCVERSYTFNDEPTQFLHAIWGLQKRESSTQNLIFSPAKSSSNFSCPCCHFLTIISMNSGSRCPVCGWIDDPSQAIDPQKKIGRNEGISLIEAQMNYSNYGAISESLTLSVRPPLQSEMPPDEWKISTNAMKRKSSSSSDINIELNDIVVDYRCDTNEYRYNANENEHVYNELDAEKDIDVMIADNVRNDTIVKRESSKKRISGGLMGDIEENAESRCCFIL